MAGKIVLFNSPKLCGKDYAIDYLNRKGYNLERAEAKDKLHALMQVVFDLDAERYWEIYNDRSLKEVPLAEFTITLTEQELDILEEHVGELYAANCEWANGWVVVLSIRQAMICVSECLMKPKFGEEYFGQARVNKIKRMEGYNFCDSSTGFINELYPLIDYLGQDNILLLRIHRKGYTFEGDSRDYIPDGVITNTIDIENNGAIQEYYDKVEAVVKELLGK